MIFNGYLNIIITQFLIITMQSFLQHLSMLRLVPAIANVHALPYRQMPDYGGKVTNNN